jgi:hypothetical protein
MHQITLLVAVAATTGLFGRSGGQTCRGGSCGSVGYSYHHSYYQPTGYAYPGYHTPMAYQPAPAPTTYASGYSGVTYPQAAAAAPAQAPAPAPAYHYQAQPTGYYYPSYYYSAASSCANGSCYRR